MKKILFLMFTFAFGFTIANAKTVGLTLDLDYNDADVFNIFYEFKNNTKIAQMITKYSFNMLDLFVDNVPDFATGKGLSFKYDYANKSKDYWNIFIFKQNNQYQFVYTWSLAFNADTILLVFDENCNLVSSKYGNRHDVLGFNEVSKFFDLTNIDKDYPYKLFSLYEGNYPLYSTNSYSLNYVKNDGQTYKLDGVDLGFFGSIGKFFTDFFKDKYTFGENWSFNFDYYNTHLVCSSSTALKTLKKSFFQMNDVDMKGYETVSINENENGVFFIPITTDESVDYSFYLYANHLNTPLYGNALLLSDIQLEDGNYDLTTNGNTFGFNLSHPCTINELPISSFDLPANSNFYNYVYHIFTTKYTEDITVYYDPKAYRFVSIVRSNEKYDFVSPSTGNHYSITSNTNSTSKNDVNNTTGGHLDEDMSGKPDKNNSSNIGSLTDYTKKYSPSNIFTSMGSVISMMGAFINEFLHSMPPEIAFCFTFFLPISLAIAIYKILRG